MHIFTDNSDTSLFTIIPLLNLYTSSPNFVPNFNSCAQQYRAIAILKNHPVTHQNGVLLSAPTRINAPTGVR